ncbi:type IV pilus biogenesis protein PilP [Salmonella enterica]|nr:type IV pilus biogenesis protein PilP [Salmonella enterica]EEP3373119.1 type IV pilus biogenesis protein PilP [Salmonella enterica]EFP6579679.1 type IV pilus biogenesis protein PilP [Salmonella enterica]EGC7971446.1 type IV pilus biogenesis protein PilP [Salmonella enterica]EIV4461671.1 type IV pilus biogenesis protein PilP [Salmonella enterica]
MGLNNIFACKKLLVVVLSFVVLAPCFAQEVKNLGDLDVINAETTLYKAIAARKKAQQEADNPDLQLSQVSQPQSMNMPGYPQQPQIATKKIESLPTVLRIMNNLVQLKYSDGSTDWKRSGEMIPGGYQLASVSVTGVWVRSVSDNKKQLLKDEAN